jgi:hypothetical protein
MIHMSEGMRRRWQEERLDELLQIVALQPDLRALVEAPFVRKAGGLLLEPLTEHVTGPEVFQDRTAYEAFVNKFHVEDLIENMRTSDSEKLSLLVQQGAKAAFTLSERLASQGNYRVLLCLDKEAPAMTLRFFERRPGEPWGEDDPDTFPFEDVLIIDTEPE